MLFPDAPASSTSSPMASLLENLELHGYRNPPGEPDPRPLPADEELTATIGGVFDHLTGTFAGTGLEADLDPVLCHSPTSSIFTSPASIATSTATSRLNDAARPNRMALNSAQSNWNSSWTKDGTFSIAVRPSSSCATKQRLTMKL